MALVYKNLNLVSKQNFSRMYLTLRSCCKVSNSNGSQLVPAGLRLRHYFTSINKELHSPEKYTKTSAKKTKLPYDIDINVPENVLLYSDGNKKILYGTLSIYGCAWFSILVFIGDSIRIAIKDVPASPEPEGEKIKWWKWWKKINLSTNALKNILCSICFIAGFMGFMFAQLYPLRIVSSMYLLRGGRLVSLATYKPFGRIKQKNYQLKDISCENDISIVERFIPFKVKGKPFYFLVDKKKGTFYNDKVFKGSVGLKREF